ncbi:MAG: hypothetical protein IPO21_07810 [Bacteroidales bacterium]|nr:hypothetical protein [Bacteroidales bacterium]
MYNLSNLTLGKLLLGLLLIAWEIFLHTISIITPFFRGKSKTINGFKFWRKGKLQYNEIISGLQDNQFFVDINYGYTSLILSNNRLKIKPYPKHGVSLSNEIIKNDKLFYVLYNNHLQVIDKDLNESGCFYSKEIVEGIFLVDNELYIITASLLFGYFNIYVTDVSPKNVLNELEKKTN